MLVLSVQALYGHNHADHARNPIDTHPRLTALADVLPSSQTQEHSPACNEGHKDEQCVRITSVPPKDVFDKTYVYVNVGLLFVGLGGLAAAFLTFRSIKTSAERQLRAYVFAESVDIGDGTNLDPIREDKRNEPGVFVVLKNTGQTPAYRVVHWMDMDVVRPKDEELKLTIPQLAPIHMMSIGASISVNRARWFGRSLSEAEIAEIGSGERAIYIYGRIEYRDVFNRKHFTTYRLHYSNSKFPPPGKSGGMTYSEKGNDAD